MEQALVSSETLTTMLSTFRKVTTSYWPGLFHCYDHADLPRTNNELEQYFSSARERHARVRAVQIHGRAFALFSGLFVRKATDGRSLYEWEM